MNDEVSAHAFLGRMQIHSIELEWIITYYKLSCMALEMIEAYSLRAEWTLSIDLFRIYHRTGPQLLFQGGVSPLTTKLKDGGLVCC